jgi:uncharacterized protein
MKIADCQFLFTATISMTRILSPEDTPVNMIAASIMEMVRAYESDGIIFLESGDPINALAGFYYGFGWLHYGQASGLLAIMDAPACPFKDPAEILPPQYRSKLEEKSHRYGQLLDTALSSVVCAPDPATISHNYAMRILFIAGVYARQGELFLKCGEYEDALACFSYGHGWLDAGVATGLYRITQNREIFCV